MQLAFYQIDAFAKQTFEGNPAAVVPLETWLPDDVMQAIAEENNLAETAFFVPTQTGFHIRWFTPTKEIALCGHATLASAFVLYKYLNYSKDILEFESLSGVLRVSQQEDLLQLDFPVQPPEPCDVPELLINALGVLPVNCHKSEDLIVLLESEKQLAELKPNVSLLEQLPLRGVAVTAPSEQYDFVVRFFAPKYGIPEDPVTGSAYTQLVPYWAKKLDKTGLHAKQLSARGGEVLCKLAGDRVLIAGKAVTYLVGKITV